jgi:hypothetical protein
MFPCSVSSCLFVLFAFVNLSSNSAYVKLLPLALSKGNKIKTNVPDLETVSWCFYAMVPGISSSSQATGFGRLVCKLLLNLFAMNFRDQKPPIVFVFQLPQN